MNTRSWMVAAACTAAALGVVPVGARQTQPPGGQRSELSQQETEVRVKAEAARRFGLRPEQVRVVESGERTWPDAGLGCNARRGMLEPSPTPGFRIVVEGEGRRLTFHTDRHGRLLRCITKPTPIDPIK